MNNKISRFFPHTNLAGCVASTINIHRSTGKYEVGADQKDCRN